ncbi:MAG: hypothetical protein FAF04_02880 [Epsilonproteobacteria bacterium]|nr:hypothetical protein [Campylobacterota bacterium]
MRHTEELATDISMKKIITSLLLATLLGTTANAFSNVTDPYDADFAKMNQYFNSLIESHLTSAKLNNIGYPRMDIADSKKESPKRKNPKIMSKKRSFMEAFKRRFNYLRTLMRAS